MGHKLDNFQKIINNNTAMVKSNKPAVNSFQIQK